MVSGEREHTSFVKNNKDIEKSRVANNAYQVQEKVLWNYYPTEEQYATKNSDNKHDEAI